MPHIPGHVPTAITDIEAKLTALQESGSFGTDEFTGLVSERERLARGAGLIPEVDPARLTKGTAGLALPKDVTGGSPESFNFLLKQALGGGVPTPGPTIPKDVTGGQALGGGVPTPGLTLPKDVTGGSPESFNFLVKQALGGIGDLNEELRGTEFARVDPTGANAAATDIAGRFRKQGVGTTNKLNRLSRRAEGAIPGVTEVVDAAGLTIGGLSTDVQGDLDNISSQFPGLSADVLNKLKGSGISLNRRGRNVSGISEDFRSTLGGLSDELGAVGGAVAGEQGAAADELSALRRSLGDQTGGIVNEFLGISRGTDPSTARRRDAVLAEIERSGEGERTAATDLLARRGLSGSTAAVNALTGVERDIGIRRELSVTGLEREELERQDAARRFGFGAALSRGEALSGLTGQEADTRFRSGAFGADIIGMQGEFAREGAAFGVGAEKFRAGIERTKADLALSGGRFAADNLATEAGIIEGAGRFGVDTASRQADLALAGGGFELDAIGSAGQLAEGAGKFNLAALDRELDAGQIKLSNTLATAGFNNDALANELGLSTAAVQNIVGLLGLDTAQMAALQAGGTVAADAIKGLEGQIRAMANQIKAQGGGTGGGGTGGSGGGPAGPGEGPGEGPANNGFSTADIGGT